MCVAGTGGGGGGGCGTNLQGEGDRVVPGRDDQNRAERLVGDGVGGEVVDDGGGGAPVGGGGARPASPPFGGSKVTVPNSLLSPGRGVSATLIAFQSI